MNDKGKIYAEYKGVTYQLVVVKALLRDDNGKDVWADVNRVNVLASNGDSNGDDSQADITDNDVATMLAALDKQAKVYRDVINKKTALSTDKKLAQAELKTIVNLRGKLAELS